MSSSFPPLSCAQQDTLEGCCLCHWCNFVLVTLEQYFPVRGIKSYRDYLSMHLYEHEQIFVVSIDKKIRSALGKILLCYHKPKEMRRKRHSPRAVQTRLAVPNHSVLEGKLAECITGCSPIPRLLPRAVAASSKSCSGSSLQSPQKSCGLPIFFPLFTTNGYRTNAPARVAGQDILLSFSQWLFFPLGHFPYAHFWVMGFSFSGCLLQN